jgi:hypothetical protein
MTASAPTSAKLSYTLSVRIDRATLNTLVAGAVGQRRRLSDYVRLVLERCLQKSA